MFRAVSRRSVVLGAAALGLCGMVRGGRAAQSARETPPLAERLAAYAAALRYDDIDAATIEAVKVHLVDTLGCGIAAFDERPIHAARDVASASAGGVATILGTNRRTAPDLAAFVNGAAFRYYDLNDVYVARQAAHPSDDIAACLAIAEAERASGADLITAIVLAYEINCRLLDAFDLTDRGWDGTVFSLPAVALAAGRLMRLDPERLTQAVNIAVNDHIPLGQTRAQTLSDWKGLADADAARSAVFAAMLARVGVTGPAPVYEGRAGFFRLVSGAVEVDVSSFGRGGRPFRIHEVGMKPYPAQVYTQTAIVAAADVAQEAGGVDRIAAVEVATTRRGYEMAGSEAEKWAPATRDTADHSLPYIVARAMFDGEVSNDSYAPEKLRDPRILAFMRNITVSEDKAFAAPRGNAPSSRVTATLHDGQRISRSVDNLPGFPGQPMGRAEVERKFRSNAGKRWPRERVAAILQGLWSLEHVGDVTALMDGLALQPSL